MLDAREAAEHRARLEAFEAARGKPVHGPQHNKSHLLFKWVDDLVDESKTAPIALAAGQASLHNVGLAHASGPNRTGDRRIGLSMHCISTRTRQTAGEWDSAALVRGEDRYEPCQLAPVPARDFDPEALAFHERASGALRDILFRDAERVRPVT